MQYKEMPLFRGGWKQYKRPLNNLYSLHFLHFSCDETQMKWLKTLWIVPWMLMSKISLKEEYATETVHVFDSFARECDLLDEHPLPAVAKILFSYDNAFVIEVLI